MLRKEDLIQQIVQLGIAKNDTVVVHVSMRSIGMIENGASGLIDAFCDYLSEGLFIVPTHSWHFVNQDNPVYNVGKTPACIGAVSEVAAFRNDGIRSLNPTHSAWVCGKNAEVFVQGEEKLVTPAPPGSLWSRLADVGAKILLIGVGNDKNSFIHAIEEEADIPDRLYSKPYQVTIVDRDGNQHVHPFTTYFCTKTVDVSDHFVNFDKPLTQMGAQRLGRFGNAEVRVVEAQKCREIILRIYSKAEDDLCLEYRDIPEELYIN